MSVPISWALALPWPLADPVPLAPAIPPAGGTTRSARLAVEPVSDPSALRSAETLPLRASTDWLPRVEAVPLTVPSTVPRTVRVVLSTVEPIEPREDAYTDAKLHHSFTGKREGFRPPGDWEGVLHYRRFWAMFSFRTPPRSAFDDALLQLVKNTQAVIQFSPDGTILEANESFCGAVEYDLAEIKGRHHRIFCSPQITDNPQYEQFWADLRAGKSFTARYPRITKSGNEIWL
jgi:PAS domain S-box-containing protein